MTRLLVVALLALAGCAAPESGPAGQQAPAQAAPDPAAGASEPGDRPPSSAGPDAAESAAPSPAPDAGPAGLPSWWSDSPVRDGATVHICAEATAPTMREARGQAIQAAYDRLEQEVGAGAAATAAIENHEVSEVQEGVQGGAAFRFRVRVSGSGEG